MKHLEFLKSRHSTPHLQEPAPSAEEIAQVWQAVIRAPDHARLKPTRLQIWQADALDRMGEIFAQSAQQATPELTEDALKRTRNLPHRAPMVAVVIASVKEHAKVPEIEQIISTGCGAYALILALNDLGYGCMWRTGNYAYDDHVKSAIGLGSNEHIVGFVYIGSQGGSAVKAFEEPAFSDCVEFFND